MSNTDLLEILNRMNNKVLECKLALYKDFTNWHFYLNTV